MMDEVGFIGKISEEIRNSALNALTDYCKKGLGIAKVSVGAAFVRYLENAAKRYNRIKTIAAGAEPRPIIGENALYVHVGVSYRHSVRPTREAALLLDINRHLLIEGTGGAGKSMLMRYLFLDTAYRGNGDYIPILLELRRIRGEAGQGLSIQSVLELVYACMQDFDVQLDRAQFEYSLRSGKYLFLLDGFDEIPRALAREAAEVIQGFCAKYPQNACIVTSRPNAGTSPLETFSTLHSLPLTKGQAIELARRIGCGNEKAEEFCDQLDRTLFKRHEDFASNPLLLSMMYLTFMRNSSIPDHLSEFYQKAYEALYSEHDAVDKGAFHREFRCALDEKDFTRLFAYFCFQSYIKGNYAFTREQILSYLDRGIEKLGLAGTDSRNFLADLQNVVCMILRDGNSYCFSHRSFQAYFAARYTCELSDTVQKRFFAEFFSTPDCAEYLDYCELLYQLAPARFAANALEDGLRAVQKRADESEDGDLYFLKQRFSGINCSSFLDQADTLLISFVKTPSLRWMNYSNMITFFLYLFERGIYDANQTVLRPNDPGAACARRLSRHSPFVRFEDVDASGDAQCAELCKTLIRKAAIAETRTAIRRWLAERDAQREALAASDSEAFFDAL